MTDYDDLSPADREREATIQIIKARLPMWADIIDDAPQPHTDAVRNAIEEMRKTAEEL